MTIPLADFVKDLTGSGSRTSWMYQTAFRREVLQRWLDDHKWVDDSAIPCAQCQHMGQATNVTEETCRQNVAQGGSCYRETLRIVFSPFVRNALAGRSPEIGDLENIVHRQGPIWHGHTDSNLGSLIDHELIGTVMRMQSEKYWG